jgi:hypothetical protein
MPTKSITPAHQQDFLKNLEAYLQEYEYEASIVETEVGDNKSYSTLYAVLDISSDQLPGENQLRMEIAFLPQAEENQSDHSILQAMVPILLADENVNKGELFGLIVKLNTFLPMGSFGYWQEQNMVYHKQNNMVANKDSMEVYATIEEQLAMIQYLLTSFVPSLAAVAVDNDSIDNALKGNPFAKAFL